MSIFVSWTGKDREIKNKIVEGLCAGLGDSEDVSESKIWDSDEDCSSNYSKECIDAIRRCSVFVVIVSDASMSPASYVLNEVIEARSCEMRGELNIVVYKVTDSEYTSEFAFQLNHISDANRIARMAGTDFGISALVKRVKYLLMRRKNGDPEKPYDVFKPIIEGTTLSRSGYFVPNSRDDIFEEIDKGFEIANVVFASQMSGYGRKSAVRKYAENHLQEYEEVLVLHLFSGTLREFFLDGLKITNINENMYEKMDENQVILRKAELLKKLDKKTLLIVPNVTIDSRDDTFVFDALAGIGCRIIFITQNLQQRLKNVFPIVSVGRMRQEYLKELFFNYYNVADEEEQAELTDTLYDFFDSVDGHTKSVEITAMALAEEYGVYPEDVSEVLSDIHFASETELGERIFKWISNVFEMKNFSEEEKKILLVAALTAVIPIDEKFFVKLLKKCDIQNHTAIRKLAENRWLDLDRQSRTISMEPLLAEVCIAKVKLDNTILYKCVKALNDELLVNAWGIEIYLYKDRLKRLKGLFEVTNLGYINELLTMCLYYINDVDINISREKVERCISTIKRKNERIRDQRLKEELEVCIDDVRALMESSLLLDGLSSRTSEGKLVEAYLENLNPMSMLETYRDVLEGSSLLGVLQQMIDMQASGNVSKIVSMYLHLCSNLDEDFSEDEQEVLNIFAMLGYQLMITMRNDSYLHLQLCYAYLDLKALIGGFTSESEAYSVYKEYMYTLMKLGDCTLELENAFEQAMRWANMGRKTIFENEASADAIINQLMCDYIEILVKNNRAEDAEKIYTRSLKCKVMCDELITVRMEAIERIANLRIKNGDTEDAVRFIKKALTKDLGDYLEKNADREAVAEAIERFHHLYQVEYVLSHPDAKHDFTDRYEEYLDYYKTYANGIADKWALSKYFSIANKAKEIDYSGKTDAQLLEMAGQLKRAAFRARKWEDIAPQAFALVSEAGYRTLGYRHHYVQYVGAAAMADGKIAEIQNGEGKTYTIILTAFLNTLFRKQVHIIDAFPFLARRNFVWMRGVLELLGCKVGLLEKNTFYKEVKHFADYEIIYSTVEALSFFKQREELGVYPQKLRYDVAIVDEADYLMITNGNGRIMLQNTETRSSLKKWMEELDLYLRNVTKEDTNLFEYDRGFIRIKPELYMELEEYLEVSFAEFRQEDMADIEELIRGGLLAYLYMEKGTDYHIVNGMILFENQALGTFYEGNAIYRYFIARKENLNTYSKTMDFQKKKITNSYTTIEFLTNFRTLVGTTATASSMKNEFKELYGKGVLCIPTNMPVLRENHKPKVFMTEKAKMQFVLQLIQQKNMTGQPVLVITGSIQESEKISHHLTNRNIEHKLLNAKNAREEALVLGNAGKLNVVTVTTAMANRGVDILLGGNPFELAKQHLIQTGISEELVNDAIYRMKDMSEEVLELRKKYDSLVSFYKSQMNYEKEQVEFLGGLCVIGTQCFDSLATEQQVRGRAGRQGVVGESYVCYSLEDQSLKRLLGERYEALYAMFGDIDGYSMDSKLLINAIMNARTKIQNENYKQLLNTPQILYYRFAREKILGLLQQIHRGEADWDELVEKYIEDYSVKYKEAVERKEHLWQMKFENIAMYVMQKNLEEAWAEYLERMKAEIASSRNVFAASAKKQKKHLEEFSETQCELLIKNAVRETIEFVLRVNPKKKEE